MMRVTQTILVFEALELHCLVSTGYFDIGADLQSVAGYRYISVWWEGVVFDDDVYDIFGDLEDAQGIK